MGGFVGLKYGKNGERRLDLDHIKELTAEANPELLRPAVEEPSTDPSLIASVGTMPLVDSNPEASPHPSSKYKILVTEDEICDKSKRNFVAKSIAFTQTAWFIIQFIERCAIHQPITQLEVMTVAYAILNIIIYIFWWNKPFDVSEPIHISGRAEDCLRSRNVGILASRSLALDGFSALVPGDPVSLGVLLPLFGTVFGGMHCLAWRFHFVTEREAQMWRVCSVYCIASPWLVIVLFLFSVLTYENEDLVSITVRLSGLVTFGYIVCRVILLVITFSCLRGSPAGVFEVTAWTRFFPHISY